MDTFDVLQTVIRQPQTCHALLVPRDLLRALLACAVRAKDQDVQRIINRHLLEDDDGGLNTQVVYPLEGRHEQTTTTK